MVKLSTEYMYNNVLLTSTSSLTPSISSELLLTGNIRKRLRQLFIILAYHSQKVAGAESTYPRIYSGAPSMLPN